MRIQVGSGCIRAATVALALFAIAASAPAKAASPKAIATALELINLKGAANMYNPILVGIIEKSKYTFMQSNPMLTNDLNAVAIQLRTELQPRLDALKSHVAELYAAQFTEKELDAALAFYKSPLGAKLIAVEPKVLDQSMAYTDEWARKLADEVVAKMRTEMRKRGHEM